MAESPDSETSFVGVSVAVSTDLLTFLDCVSVSRVAVMSDECDSVGVGCECVIEFPVSVTSGELVREMLWERDSD